MTHIFSDDVLWGVVKNGMVGVGATPHLAFDNLEDTEESDPTLAVAKALIENDLKTGSVSEVASNLRPVSLSELVSLVGESNAFGKISYESEAVATYVSLFPNGDDEGAVDCSVYVGKDELGLFWFKYGDDAVTEICDKPYASREDVVKAAEEFAEDNHEGLDGEDAKDLIKRVRTEQIEEGKDPEGSYAVIWVNPDRNTRTVGNRYHNERAAYLEVSMWEDAVLSHTPTALLHLMVHPTVAMLDEDGNEVVGYECYEA